MNLTLPALSSFANNSQQELYKVDNSTTPCVLLIGPLMKLAHGYVYQAVTQAGGAWLSALRSHAYDLNKSLFITEWLKIAYLELSIGYGFLLAAFAMLLVIPFFTWKKCCARSSISMSKNQGCFCVEGMLFIIASVSLFFGAVSSLQTAIHVDEAMQTQPTLAGDIVDDLLAYRNNLHANLVALKNDHDIMLDFVLESVTNIPDNVSAIAVDVMSPVIPIAKLVFNNLHKTFVTSLQEAGLATQDGSYDAVRGRALTETLSNAEDEVRAVSVALESLAAHIFMDDQLNADKRRQLAVKVTDIKNKCVLHFDPNEMPTWTTTMQLLNETITRLLPQVNKSIHFLDTLSEDLESYLKPVMLDRLAAKVRQLKAWSNHTVADFNAISESIAPTLEVEGIRRRISQVGDDLKRLDVSSTWTEIVFSGRTLLVMTPSLHGLLVLMLATIGGIVGLSEVKRLHRVGSKTLLNSGKSLGARIMRSGTLVALWLLWLHLLTAGVSYIFAMLAATTCFPVLDMTIFTNYTDDLEVWNGKTWMESKLENFTYDTNLTRGVKLLDVLESCSHDDTVFHAIMKDKAWNLEEMFSTHELEIEEEELLFVLYNTLKNMELHNYFRITKEFDSHLVEVRRHLSYNFTNMIDDEVDRFTNMSLIENSVKAVVDILPRDPKYDYIQDRLHQVIDDLERIEQHTLPNISETFRRLLPLSGAFDEAQLSLAVATVCLTEVYPMITNSFLPKVTVYMNLVTKTTNNFVNNFAQEAVRKVNTKMGNCRVIYNLFMKARWSLCDQGVTLLNAVWMSHGMMGIAMIPLMMLSIRMAAYFRGAHRNHATWKLRLESQRLEQEVASAEAIMMNERGELLGNVVLKGHRNRYNIRDDAEE